MLSNFTIIDGEERDNLILEILKREYNTTNEGNSRWVKGWAENRDAFIKTKDVASLVPKYIRSAQPIRFFGDFVRPNDPNYEARWYKEFSQAFFQDNLGGFGHIFELGCGSGHNLATIKNLFPNAKCYGLDWAKPSIDIAKELGCEGILFDFFNPDYDLQVPKNSCFFTCGAIEQTGKRWGKLLDFILAKRPRRVCHIEPIYEWYDENKLVDYTAMVAHQKKDFCIGYWPRLKELEKESVIKITKADRTNIGSLFIEGYSQLVWEIL